MSSESSPNQQVILDRLRSAEQLLAEFDLTLLEPEHLPAITAAVRRVQNRCTAATIAIAKQARATGDDPDATLLGRGGVSGGTARKENERSATAEAMPAVDDAVTAGEVSAEHLDAISRARRGLNDAERSMFDQLAPELAKAAASMPVDTFKRTLRAIVDRCRDDHGLTRLEQ